jgi:Na+/H+ antiporter NhaB
MIIFIRISPAVVLAVALAVIVGHSSGMISAVLAALLIVAAVVAVTVTIAVVHRLRFARNPSPQGFIQAGPAQELGAEERPALPQHVHFHFGAGADPAAVAEILRRSQRPEQ